MINNVAALEITSSHAKFGVGSVVNGKPCLLYYEEKELPALSASCGKIIDKELVAKTISSFAKLSDEALCLKIDTDDISLVVPPMGLTVYQKDGMTMTINSVVDKIDMNNVMALVRKQVMPGNLAVVDIVPDCFIVDSARTYSNPPLGESGTSLTIQAKIHAISKAYYEEYRQCAEEAKYRVRRCDVSTYCASQLIASEKRYPNNYFLLDIGEDLTSVSFIGETSLFSTYLIPSGSRKITESLAEKLGIMPSEAEEIKRKYGYNPRERLYRAPLIASGVKFDSKSVNQSKVNEAIDAFFASYAKDVNNAIASMAEKYISGADAASSTFPVILIGGGSKLNGLVTLLKKYMPNREFIKYVPSVMGARDPAATNVLGLILIAGEYRGNLEDGYHGIGVLSREKESING